MKPNFALHFTDDGIALLHRSRRGWTEIGSTPFDVPDLPAALAALRDQAAALAPDGVTTKIVIPNSQIRYIAVNAPGPDAARRRTQIAAALEGQTPYDVADLVWDHWGKGPQVQVAVLARETLEEAESFAVTHGFAPLSFVAIPPDPSYGGEPWFGATAHASGVLKPGEKVDRDQDPITLHATAAAPKAEPEPQPAPEPAPQPEPQPEPAPQPEPEPAPVELPPAPPEPPSDPGRDPLPAAEPLPVPAPDPAPATAPPDLPQDLPGYDPLPDPLQAADRPTESAAPTPAEDAAAPATAAPRPVDPASIAATLNAPDPLPPGGVTSPVLADPEEAPILLDVPEDPTPDASDDGQGDLRADSPTTAAASRADAGTDLPPMPSAIAMAAFNSRARAEAPASPRPTAPRIAAPAADRTAPRADRTAAPRPAPKFGYETPGERPAQPQGKGLKSLGAIVTATSIPGGRKARAPAPPAAPQPAPDTTLTRRPSGLGSRPMPVRGKPRHLGLILTGLLLIMLALAAGLSSFYVSWRDTTPAVDVAALPAPEDEIAADAIHEESALPPPAAEVPSSDATAAEATAARDILPEAVAEQPAAPSDAEIPTPAPGPQGVAITESAPAADAAPQDEIFLAASDTAPRTTDAATLPAPLARNDAQPQAPPPPPPFGTVYQFDSNGLIVPTPEGIVTPEGVLLTSGRPAITPPERPEELRAATAAAPEATAADPAADQAADPAAGIATDPALATARPLPRPAALRPPQDDGAALPLLPDLRLAGVRPPARPGDIIATARAGNNGSLALVTPDGTVSPMGLAISRRPAARPQDMARAIEEAVAAVANLPPPTDPVAPDAAAPEAEAEPEPDLASAAPAIPSTANVARQATVANALNLREISLVGVFGTPSDRHALVRNPNGRILRVAVGDRLDGGRVAAITASELRYEKRGQMLVLALPDS